MTQNSQLHKSMTSFTTLITQLSPTICLPKKVQELQFPRQQLAIQVKFEVECPRFKE